VSFTKALRGLGVALMPLGLSFAAMAGDTHSHPDPQDAQALSGGRSFSPLIAKARAATQRYVDINVALREGWVVGTPCVSGPEEGAMGVHLLKPERIHDGLLNVDEPEALIYEPLAHGAMRLVGVEYFVMAAEWAALNPQGGVPVLDGHLTNYVGEPNRFGLPAFYELHVWAWEDNPKGSFADWNTQVSCVKQPGQS
jgi:hypothetical protein